MKWQHFDRQRDNVVEWMLYLWCIIDCIFDITAKAVDAIRHSINFRYNVFFIKLSILLYFCWCIIY